MAVWRDVVKRVGSKWMQSLLAAVLTVSVFLTLALRALPASGQGMAIPGKFEVDANGAATYNIPIAVPAGTAGMTPSLSLSYNSQQGNGILGVGWSLSGLPLIDRCPRTIAQDGVRGSVTYDANDRFCFGGQRLIAISGTYGGDGTEYRTEIESFAKIISRGSAGTGPAWFEIRTRTGQIMEFGNTADSRILAQGNSTARSWAVNKVADASGNYFAVTYTNDAANGQAYPSRIDYTANDGAGLSAYNSVRFVYDTSRADALPMYRAGSLIKTIMRLIRVEVYAGPQLVSEFRLAYQQTATTGLSLMSSVTRCAGSGICLPPTTFTWPDADSIAFGPPVTFQFGGGNFHYDFNGDGRADIWFPGGANGSVHSGSVQLSNGDGTFAAAQSWQIPTPGYYLETPYTDLVDDFTGDGLADIVSSRHEWVYYSDLWRIGMGISKGDGTFTPALWTGKSICGGILYKGDFNGDSRADLLLSCPGLSDWTTRVAFSNGDGTFAVADWQGPSGDYTKGALKGPIYAGDINGDGRTDLILIADGGTSWQARLHLSIGDGTFTAPMTWLVSKDYSQPTIIDLNGDGLADMSMSKNSAGYVAYSKGDGTFAEPTQINGEPLGTAGILAGLIGPQPDFNGDGLFDSGAVSAGAPASVRPMKADGTYGEFIALPSGFAYFWGGDINGDGRRDIISLGSTSHTSLTSARAYAISMIANGLGAKVVVSYHPLSGLGAPYLKDSGATYPIQDVQGAIYVVSKVEISNGIGGTLASQYGYVGAKADVSGRGFLGFRQVVTTHLDTNVVKTSTYRQDFPYVGFVSNETTARGGVTLKTVTTTHDAINAGGTRHVVFVQKKVESGADLNGAPLPTVTTEYQYDGYGNTTQLKSSTTDGFGSTTTYTYANDITNWLLGQMTAAQVTRQAPQ